MKANFMTSLRPIILPRAAGIYLWQNCARRAAPNMRMRNRNRRAQSQTQFSGSAHIFCIARGTVLHAEYMHNPSHAQNDIFQQSNVGIFQK